MSGIAGFVTRNGKIISPETLKLMMQSLRHRGSDGEGVWHEGLVGLAHCQLAVTPEDFREKQPLYHRDSKSVIIADARIDNRTELIGLLGLSKRPHHAIPDSELILNSFLRWRENCTDFLLGDFAFAIWNADNRELFCARDPVGARTLFYRAGPDFFAFASEIKAIHCIEESPRRINKKRIADLFARQFDDQQITIYQGIYQLPAGHHLLLQNGDLSISKYWHLDPNTELKLSNDTEYAEAFRELFQEAVRCRLRSRHQVGSTLSGGLDSSSIACMARNVKADNSLEAIHTYSIVFPSLPAPYLKLADEREYMHAVIDQGGFEPHFIEADRLNPLMDLNRMLAHTDEPFLAPNAYLHWSMYAKAKEHNATVFLDGIDGDTTVSHGLGYLEELFVRGRWIKLLSNARSLSKRFDQNIPVSRLIWQLGIRPLVPEMVNKARRRQRGKSTPSWMDGVYLNQSFIQEQGLQERYANHFERSRPKLNARGDHWLALTSPLIPYTLGLANRLSSAFSIDARYPFCDQRLMRFCLSLPPGQKLHDGWDRYIMRKALEGILPEKIQWRKRKADLSPNIKRNLLTFNRPLLEEAVADKNDWLKEYLDMKAIRNVYTRYQNAPEKGNTEAMTMLGIAVIYTFLRSLVSVPAST